MVTSSRESLEKTHRKVEKVSEEQNYDEITPTMKRQRKRDRDVLAVI